MGLMFVSRAFVGTCYIMLVVLGNEQVTAASLFSGDSTYKYYFSLGVTVGMDVVLSVAIILLLVVVCFLWRKRGKEPHTTITSDTSAQTSATATQSPIKPEEEDNDYLTPVFRAVEAQGQYQGLQIEGERPTSTTGNNMYSEIPFAEAPAK